MKTIVLNNLQVRRTNQNGEVELVPLTVSISDEVAASQSFKEFRERARESGRRLAKILSPR